MFKLNFNSNPVITHVHIVQIHNVWTYTWYMCDDRIYKKYFTCFQADMLKF